MIVILGDLINAKEKYIGHICNCLSQRSVGIAKNIFSKYPYADAYSARIKPDKLGTIKILGDGINNRFVINMFAQYYPGKPKYPESELDGTIARQQYFYQCLLKIAKIPNLESIAFPYKIGCSLGGGNWDYYFGVLSNFSKYVYEKFYTKVVCYQKL